MAHQTVAEKGQERTFPLPVLHGQLVLTASLEARPSSSKSFLNSQDQTQHAKLHDAV